MQVKKVFAGRRRQKNTDCNILLRTFKLKLAFLSIIYLKFRSYFLTVMHIWTFLWKIAQYKCIILIIKIIIIIIITIIVIIIIIIIIIFVIISMISPLQERMSILSCPLPFSKGLKPYERSYMGIAIAPKGGLNRWIHTKTPGNITKSTLSGSPFAFSVSSLTRHSL